MPAPGVLADLEAALGHRFARAELLEQALTHASIASNGTRPSLERLEFLGDRVLALAIASDLLRRFPDEDEGALARRLARIYVKTSGTDILGPFRTGGSV